MVTLAKEKNRLEFRPDLLVTYFNKITRIMQFGQPDTLIPEPYNPQSWNRYAYAKNNPILYNDPTGHDVGCAGGEADYCGFYGNSSKGNDYGWKPPAHLVNSIDSGYDRASIGGVPATQPFRNTPYGDIEDSCDGCSAEGAGESLGADALGLFSDVLVAGLNAKAIYDDDAISVYVFYRKPSNSSNLEIRSLLIENRLNRPVYVASVSLTPHEWTPRGFCTPGALCLCFAAPNCAYQVSPPAIVAAGVNTGIGTANPGLPPNGLTTRILLTPSGYSGNPNNTFYWNEDVTMKVTIADTSTGNAWPPIFYTFGH